MKTNKYFIATAIFLMTVSAVIAQHDEPVILSVSYNFKHVYDTNNRAMPYTKGMVLHLGETNSKYTDGDAETTYKEQKRQMENAPPRTAKVVTGMLAAMVSSILNDKIYQMPYESKMIRTTTLGSTNYLMELKAPEIKWKIEKETKKIDKYNCQKAVGVFGGRTYTAWFTSELPFKNGPWKLCGLPGLILEAQDDKNEVAFIFKEITKGEADERITLDGGRQVKVDEADFARAKKMFTEDPTAAAQAEFPSYKSPITIFYKDPTGKMYSGEEAIAAIKNDGKVNNNPIERTKK